MKGKLKPGGLFVFDMNTIYGLAVLWQRYPAYINEVTPESFEVQRTSYDFETNIATCWRSRPPAPPRDAHQL